MPPKKGPAPTTPENRRATRSGAAAGSASAPPPVTQASPQNVQTRQPPSASPPFGGWSPFGGTPFQTPPQAGLVPHGSPMPPQSRQMAGQDRLSQPIAFHGAYHYSIESIIQFIQQQPQHSQYSYFIELVDTLLGVTMTGAELLDYALRQIDRLQIHESREVTLRLKQHREVVEATKPTRDRVREGRRKCVGPRRQGSQSWMTPQFHDGVFVPLCGWTISSPVYDELMRCQGENLSPLEALRRASASMARRLQQAPARGRIYSMHLTREDFIAARQGGAARATAAGFTAAMESARRNGVWQGESPPVRFYADYQLLWPTDLPFIGLGERELLPPLLTGPPPAPRPGPLSTISEETETPTRRPKPRPKSAAKEHGIKKGGTSSSSASRQQPATAARTSASPSPGPSRGDLPSRSQSSSLTSLSSSQIERLRPSATPSPRGGREVSMELGEHSPLVDTRRSTGFPTGMVTVRAPPLNPPSTPAGPGPRDEPDFFADRMRDRSPLSSVITELDAMSLQPGGPVALEALRTPFSNPTREQRAVWDLTRREASHRVFGWRDLSDEAHVRSIVREINPHDLSNITNRILRAVRDQGRNPTTVAFLEGMRTMAWTARERERPRDQGEEELRLVLERWSTAFQEERIFMSHGQNGAPERWLSRQDLECLMENRIYRGRLNDDVLTNAINLFVDPLQHQLVEPAAMAAYLGNLNAPNVEQFMPQILVDRRLILMPLHLNGDHWALALANTHTGQFAYYDSAHDAAQEARAMAAVWRLLTARFPGRRWTQNTGVRSNQQDYSFDCGMFVVENAVAVITSGQMVDRVSPSSRAAWARALLMRACQINGYMTSSAIPGYFSMLTARNQIFTRYENEGDIVDRAYGIRRQQRQQGPPGNQ